MKKNLGRVAINPMGDYVAGTTYQRLDMISLNGVAYISRENDNTDTPPTSKWVRVMDTLTRSEIYAELDALDNRIDDNAGYIEDLQRDVTSLGDTDNYLQEQINDLATKIDDGGSGSGSGGGDCGCDLTEIENKVDNAVSTASEAYQIATNAAHKANSLQDDVDLLVDRVDALEEEGGGSGSGSGTTSGRKWAGKNVVFIGDITTHGQFTTGAIKEPKVGTWAHTLCKDTGLVYHGHITTENGGVGDIWRALAGNFGYNTAEYWADVDVVVVMVGASDWAHNINVTDYNEDTNIRYSYLLSHINEMILAKNPNIKIVYFSQYNIFNYVAPNTVNSVITKEIEIVKRKNEYLGDYVELYFGDDETPYYAKRVIITTGGETKEYSVLKIKTGVVTTNGYLMYNDKHEEIKNVVMADNNEYILLDNLIDKGIKYVRLTASVNYFWTEVLTSNDNDSNNTIRILPNVTEKTVVDLTTGESKTVLTPDERYFETDTVAKTRYGTHVMVDNGAINRRIGKGYITNTAIDFSKYNGWDIYGDYFEIDQNYNSRTIPYINSYIQSLVLPYDNVYFFDTFKDMIKVYNYYVYNAAPDGVHLKPEYANILGHYMADYLNKMK